MKKIIVILLVALFSVSVFAQKKTDTVADKQFYEEYPACFGEGNLALQIGVGLIQYGIYGDTVIPPISISADYGLPIAGLPISFGAFLGYSKSEYSYTYFVDATFTYSYYVGGLRAAWHFNTGVDKLDTYAGVLLGYTYVDYSFESNDPYYDSFFESYNTGSSWINYGGYVGARYYFIENFAVFAELGYGVALINFGATLQI